MTGRNRDTYWEGQGGRRGEVEDEDVPATVAEGTVEEDKFQDGDVPSKVPTEVAEEQGKEQEQEEGPSRRTLKGGRRG